MYPEEEDYPDDEDIKYCPFCGERMREDRVWYRCCACDYCTRKNGGFEQ